jgi:abortive infection bacteriophage resistance protein
MAYSKPYLPIPDQLALIKSRGMVVSDDALAQSHLNKIGYYRLSGYW